MRSTLAGVTGLAAFLMLFPFSGQDSDPPKFFSVFGYEVPVGGIWLSLLVGISVGAFVWALVSRKGD